MTKDVQGAVRPPFAPPEVQVANRLEGIFMPLARRQRDALYANNTRFVHYTSAEAALGIIGSKRVWMRNATCMADYREVQHGFEMLVRLFRDEAKRKRFDEALEPIFPGVANDAINLFDQWGTDIRINTYIASMSEHDDKEDSHGRLSMWRAFGGNAARVAIVLRVPGFSSGAAVLNLMFSPVAYLTENEVHAQFQTVCQNIGMEAEFLHSVNRELVVGTIFHMLVAGVTCLKHEGFHEEREWRAIYSPKRSASSLMDSSTEIIGGVPQLVHKLPLDAGVSEALTELDLAKMFDRLIVGPTQYPLAIREAFVAALTTSGIADAANRVVVSNIPIRT